MGKLKKLSNKLYSEKNAAEYINEIKEMLITNFGEKKLISFSDDLFVTRCCDFNANLKGLVVVNGRLFGYLDVYDFDWIGVIENIGDGWFNKKEGVSVPIDTLLSAYNAIENKNKTHIEYDFEKMEEVDNCRVYLENIEHYNEEITEMFNNESIKGIELYPCCY